MTHFFLEVLRSIQEHQDRYLVGICVHNSMFYFVPNRFFFHVAALASLTIFGIVVSIIGLFTALGAKLDLVRSMIYIMVVGLSVDYVVRDTVLVLVLFYFTVCLYPYQTFGMQ